MSCEIGAVVVTYNSAAVIERCLRSLEGLAQVVVVDNASADRTRDVVSKTSARLIPNPANRGFAAAVNQGVQALSTPLILVINPDAELLTPLDGESPIARRALEEGVGAVGGKLVRPYGDYQRGFCVRGFPTPWTLAAEVLLLNRLWPSNPINRAYRRWDFDPETAQKCDQPAGALLLFRREVFDRIGGFDKEFFPLWFEDVDFCLRLHRAGFELYYEPSCVAAHLGAHSLSAMPLQTRQAAWYGSLLRFVDKHFTVVAASLIRPAVALGLALRGSACLLGQGRRQDGREYFRAIRRIFASPGPADGDAGLRKTSAA